MKTLAILLLMTGMTTESHFIKAPWALTIPEGSQTLAGGRSVRVDHRNSITLISTPAGVAEPVQILRPLPGSKSDVIGTPGREARPGANFCDPFGIEIHAVHDQITPDADAPALARRIDDVITAPLAKAKIAPAPRCDDATFYRRIHLVLTGRIATSEALTKFLNDTDSDKRTKAIDALLNSKDSVEHFVIIWRGWLIPEAATNPEVAGSVNGFDAWLRERLTKATPYDRMVKELLTAPMTNRPTMARPVTVEGEQPAAVTNPLGWYLAKEAKPENLAAAASRMFLGIQLECAQCHDHPTAKWSRDQFWGTAAFFGGIDRTGGNLREVFDRREMAIPNANRTVQATFLDDKEPTWQYKQSARVTFAEWVVAKDNPYFAKAAVNRLWGYLFGVGLVDPVDAFDDKNPPSHPQLLEIMAKLFVESNYDLRFILKTICLSDAFQRSSVIADVAHDDVRTFARFPMQGQSPEQLVAGLNAILGPKPVKKAEPNQPPVFEDSFNGQREFRETFALNGKRTESQTTILQALALMNGREITDATGLKSSKVLKDVMASKAPLADRIDQMYLAVLNRHAKPDEVSRVTAYLATGTEADRFADVLWVLLNSLEFRTIH